LKAKSLTVVAGPNGSGKSTLIEHLIRQGVDFGEYINADNIVKAHGLTGDEGARAGQKLADEARDRCLKTGIDFSFETVMSHPSKVEFMLRAKRIGFEVTLYFVATDDPLLNVERVRARVEMGGHDVPQDRIVARYKRTIALLPQALTACDNAILFDNSANAASGENGLRPVLQARHVAGFLSLEFRPPVPEWVLYALNFDDTDWRYHDLRNVDGTIFAILARIGSVDLNKDVSVGAPIQNFITMLEKSLPGEKIRLHPLK
jgi:predicted ABC-type ATPase